VERLTQKDLRALLEFIKECYPICDLETFAQRVVSRLSKIVSTEIISYNGLKSGGGGMLLRLMRMTPIAPSVNKFFERRVRAHPVIIHDEKRPRHQSFKYHRLPDGTPIPSPWF
jgi:hypothetical protein